jgi:hypothetical protein
MSFNLPPTATTAPPQFLDLPACQAWIKRLLRLQPALVQAQLLEQLRLLNGYTLPPLTRLNMLEALQIPIRFVQAESVHGFAGHPLPLAPQELAAAEATQALWRALLQAYLRCLDRLVDGDTSLTPCAAMICQRPLAVLADAYCDLVRAGRVADAALWRCAHAIYASAERLGVALIPLRDALRTPPEQRQTTLTPTAAYAELVLLAAASLHELSLREQRWVIAWARRWAGKLAVQAAAPELRAALPLCVDLGGTDPPSFLPQAGPGARWLITDALRKSLKQRMNLLARGDPADTPERLGLGTDCPLPACSAALHRLYPRWVKGGVQRRYERHPLRGPCRLVAGVEAIHYYVSGHQGFRPPGSTTADELRRQREQLALYDTVSSRFNDSHSQDQGYRMESWSAVEDWGLFDHAEHGLCLTRSLATAGGRLGIGQLVAAQPAVSSQMLLGRVRWTQQRDDLLVAGIELLPGRPQPVAVRRTGVLASTETYQRGFLLTDAPNDQAAVALILPPGYYKPERIIEVWTAMATRRFKLLVMVECGIDYEFASGIELT